MMVYAVIYCRRQGEDREKIKEKMTELRSKGFLKLLKESFWALLSPVVVLGGIYSGIVTPTEAACISVFYSLFVSLVIYRSFTIKEIIPFLGNAVKTYAPLCFVLAFATAFGRVLALAKAPILIEDFILNNFSSSISVLTGIVVIFLLLGMVMDTGPAIVILAPILLPAVQSLGVDPVHFGVIMVCCLSIGLATPPFGLDLFVAGTLSDTPPMSVAKKAIPFILAFGIALFVITYIPWFSLAFL
jgi:C4-dicarboxylate transporter DctM subunit